MLVSPVRFHHDAFINPQYEGPELQNALFAHSRMGYNFVISEVRVGLRKNFTLTEIDSYAPNDNDIETVSVDVTIEQKGIAPFYYPLNLQLHCYDTNRNKTQIRTKPGVETIVDQNSGKTFTFVDVAKSCLSNLTLTLDSPNVYPGRPVQFAQRGLYHNNNNNNNERTSSSSVSILNVPLPTHQNLIDAIEFYNVTTTIPTVGENAPTTVSSIAPTSLPTSMDAIQVSPSPAPSLMTVSYESPTKHPTISPTKSRIVPPIHPPIAPTIRIDKTNAPTKSLNKIVTTIPAPIYVPVNHTNNSSGSNNTTLPPLDLTPVTSSNAAPSTMATTTIALLIIAGSVLCATAAFFVVSRYCSGRQRSTRTTPSSHHHKVTLPSIHSADHGQSNIDSCNNNSHYDPTSESDDSVIDVIVTATMIHHDDDVTAAFVTGSRTSKSPLDPPDFG